MDEDRLAIEARLIALEYLLPHVAKIALLAVGATTEHIAGIRRRANELWAAETFPDGGPAMSDHMAAEIQEAIDDLLAEVERQVKAARGR